MRKFIEKFNSKERGVIGLIGLFFTAFTGFTAIAFFPKFTHLFANVMHSIVSIFYYILTGFVNLIPVVAFLVLVAFALFSLYIFLKNYSAVVELCKRDRDDEEEEEENKEEKKVETRGRKRGGNNAPKVEVVKEQKQDKPKQD